jgi:hypothetical protein
MSPPIASSTSRKPLIGRITAPTAIRTNLLATPNLIDRFTRLRNFSKISSTFLLPKGIFGVRCFWEQIYDEDSRGETQPQKGGAIHPTLSTHPVGNETPREPTPRNILNKAYTDVIYA